MSGNLDDKLGRKKRSLEGLLRMLNDLKSVWPSEGVRIDKLQTPLIAENMKVSEDLLAGLRNYADAEPRNTRGEGLSKIVNDIRKEFEFYRNACADYDAT